MVKQHQKKLSDFFPETSERHIPRPAVKPRWGAPVSSPSATRAVGLLFRPRPPTKPHRPGEKSLKMGVSVWRFCRFV